MNLDDLRLDCSIKQKKGLHFILASIVIWTLVTLIHLTQFPILTKNLLTFSATAPLVPLAFLISKMIKVNFTDKTNPLNQLGVIFSLNQMLYLLIAMWVYPTLPDKLVMVIAMIFGSHLLPYAWLYQSRIYAICAIVIPFIALYVGLNYETFILPALMILIEIIFSTILAFEVKQLQRK